MYLEDLSQELTPGVSQALQRELDRTPETELPSALRHFIEQYQAIVGNYTYIFGYTVEYVLASPCSILTNRIIFEQGVHLTFRQYSSFSHTTMQSLNMDLFHHRWNSRIFKDVMMQVTLLQFFRR